MATNQYFVFKFTPQNFNAFAQIIVDYPQIMIQHTSCLCDAKFIYKKGNPINQYLNLNGNTIAQDNYAFIGVLSTWLTPSFLALFEVGSYEVFNNNSGGIEAFKNAYAVTDSILSLYQGNEIIEE